MAAIVLRVNSRNLCAHTYKANARINAHNGKVAQLHPVVHSSCQKKHKKHKRK